MLQGVTSLEESTDLREGIIFPSCIDPSCFPIEEQMIRANLRGCTERGHEVAEPELATLGPDSAKYGSTCLTLST